MLENTKITADGSVTFFNVDFKEHYHSLDGARDEALAKYIFPSEFEKRFGNGSVSVLDICFGLGYNTLLAVEETVRFNGKLNVIALEIDKIVVDEAAKSIDDSENQLNWKKILSDIYHDSVYADQFCDIKMLWGDARKNCTFLIEEEQKFDLIYHDPFSTQRNAELWTVDFFRKLYTLLNDDGLILTYSTSLPVIIGFINAGFYVGRSKKVGVQRVGLVIAKNRDILCNPYSKNEINDMKILPKAIPYSDLSQNSTNNEILKNRNEKVINPDAR